MDTSYLQPTSHEVLAFASQYRSLDSFLIEFLDLTEEVKSLQEILDSVLRNKDYSNGGNFRQILREGRAFMAQTSLPWTVIIKATNHYFNTKEEAFTWLADALDQIEATLRD